MYCWMGVFRVHTRASTPLLAPSHLTEDRRWHGYQTIKSFNFKRSTPLTHFFCCCFFCTNTDENHQLACLMSHGEKKKHTQTHTVGPSGLVSAVKALLSHRLMCFGFSTSCKWKQSAHIQDNQKIFKRKKWPTTLRKPPRHAQAEHGGAVARDAISSLNKEGAEKATAHWQGEPSCQIRQLKEFPVRLL